MGGRGEGEFNPVGTPLPVVVEILGLVQETITKHDHNNNMRKYIYVFFIDMQKY